MGKFRCDLPNVTLRFYETSISLWRVPASLGFIRPIEARSHQSCSFGLFSSPEVLSPDLALFDHK